MSLLSVIKKKEVESYFKAVVLPQLEDQMPYMDFVNCCAFVKEDDKICPIADRRTYLVKGKKLKPGRIYSATYQKPTGDKSACYLIEDVAAAYSVEKFKKLSNLYAYAKTESTVFLFTWK